MQKNTYSSTSTKQRHHVSGTGCSKLFVGASGTSSNTETAKVQAQLIIILYIYIYNKGRNCTNFKGSRSQVQLHLIPDAFNKCLTLHANLASSRPVFRRYEAQAQTISWTDAASTPKSVRHGVTFSISRGAWNWQQISGLVNNVRKQLYYARHVLTSFQIIKCFVFSRWCCFCYALKCTLCMYT